MAEEALAAAEAAQAPMTEPVTTPAAAAPTTPTPNTAPEAKDESLLSGKPAKAEGAPEKYADFKAPEGFELDKESMEKASVIFKELNLSQDQAQKLVDYYSGLSKADAESTQNRFKEMVTGWREESLNHPDLKGKMERNGPVLTAVAKTIDSLGPELAGAFREVMDLTGVGNHPAFIRAFYALAQQLSEPGHVTGRGPSAFGQAAPGRQAGPGPGALYPNLPSA